MPLSIKEIDHYIKVHHQSTKTTTIQ